MIGTDSQNEHSVFVLSPPETLNNCKKIVILNSKDIFSGLGNSVSLYNIDEVYSYAISNLVKGENPVAKELEKKAINAAGDEAFHYEGDLKRGFDTIICISDSGETLGYIKYLEAQGTRPRPINIKIKLVPSALNDDSNELRVSYDIEGLILENQEKDKYDDTYLNIGEARKKIQWGDNQYSNHVSSQSNMFLSDFSVINGERAVKLDLCYGEKLNPYPDTNFDNYSIGYVAGGDLALYSWSSTGYSVTSLCLKDIYGNPKSYIKTKEGRAPIPRYSVGGKEKDVRLEYISGRYIACSVGNMGIKLYDSYLNSWLPGNTLISDPYSEINKVYKLPSNRVHYSDLSRIVPAVERAFILSGEKKKILQPYRILGNWVIFREDYNADKLLICGPTLRLYILTSEFLNLMFLNDYTLILKDSDYSYKVFSSTSFESFASDRYSSAFPEATYGGEKLSDGESAYSFNLSGSSLRFYKRLPEKQQTTSISIMTTFAGLIFYKDSENRLYYL